jgi:hypothetical protein
MKRTALTAAALAVLGFLAFAVLRGQQGAPEKNFYESSLHYTSRGLEHWYAKEQGGLERITGLPFADVPCARCHVRTCDACHVRTVDGRPVYSAAAARDQKVCQSCHGIESLTAFEKDPNDPAGDVHFRSGMECLDCHTAREVHGDGTAYVSFQQEGAMDVTCVKCHADLSGCPGARVHGDKLDCNACHVRDLPSCYNCHFRTRVEEGKSVSLPLNNLLFLVNRRGKVTLGDMHTFVYGKKTMITFAPSFPHAVMKEGRSCPDCHAAPLLEAIKAGTFEPVAFKDGRLTNVTGIVPVLDPLRWKLVFLDYAGGRWTPLAGAAAPLLNYAGYCSPLTPEQFERLAEAHVPDEAPASAPHR